MKGKGRPILLRREKEGVGIASLVVAAITIIVLYIAAAGIWFRETYVAYEVFGSSMQQTLFEGDWVYGRQGAHAERGDIVIVDVSDRPKVFEDEFIIKRLIAVEGDTVRCSGGVISVQRAGGEFEELDEPYAYGVTADFRPVTLQKGEVFVVGDNREESYDCRNERVGPLRYERIVAVVPDWAVAWKSSIGAWETFCGDARSFIRDLF